MYYAQQSNGFITSLLETPDVLPESENYILIDSLDEAFLGCVYENGVIVLSVQQTP